MKTRTPYTYQRLSDPRDKRILVLKHAENVLDPLVADLQHWPHFPDPLIALSKHKEDGRLKDCAKDDCIEEEEYDEEIRKHQERVSKYTAVSYAWGHATWTVPLYLGAGEDETVLQISKAVHEMLSFFRNFDFAVPLWVDAICINQADIVEKESQVQRMGNIYAQAESVMIWIGSPLGWTIRDAKMFKLLSRIQFCRSQEEARSEVQDSLLSIEKLLERDWFYRRWIIQEVALAKTAIIMCGHYYIRFNDFVGGLAMLASSHDVKHHTTDVAEKMQLMLSLQEYFQGDHRYKTKVTTLPPIATLLSIFHSAQCSDDRDRLFALRSITHTDNFSVSYTAPVEKVFYQFSLMQALSNAEYFGISAAFRSRTHSAPSWVADWREPPRYTPISTTANFRDRSTVIQKKEVFKYADNAFKLTGVLVGTITKAIDSEQETPLETLQRWHTLYHQSERKKCPRFRLDNFNSTIGATLFDTLGLGQTNITLDLFLKDADLMHFSILLNGRRRTLANSLIAQFRSPSMFLRVKLFPRFEDFVRPSWPRLYHEHAVAKRDQRTWNSDGMNRQAELIRTFISSCAKNRQGRCAFVTDAGDFGLGPAGAMPGDIVVRIPNSRIPLVLHRTTKVRGNVGLWAPYHSDYEYHVEQEDENLEGECWSVVGDCYIQRFMGHALTHGEDGMRGFRLV